MFFSLSLIIVDSDATQIQQSDNEQKYNSQLNTEHSCRVILDFSLLTAVVESSGLGVEKFRGTLGVSRGSGRH